MDKTKFFSLKAVSVNQYFAFPEKDRTALSDYYAKEAQNGGKLYVLCCENEILSYGILSGESRKIRDITFLYTIGVHRRKGYATALLDKILAAERETSCFRIHLVTSQPAYTAIRRLAEKAGFVQGFCSTVYTADTDASMWKRMDEIPFEKMEKLILSRGGTCCSFEELDEEGLSAVRNSSESAFGNVLSPKRYLDGTDGSFSPSLSFALFQRGELKAYTLVRRPKVSHVIIEQIASAADVRGSGYVIAPLAETLRGLREDPFIQKMSLTIGEYNTASKNFLFQILKGVELKKTEAVNLYGSSRHLDTGLSWQ